MGDMGDTFNGIKQHKKDQRSQYGLPCPMCNVKQPKRIPTILMPGQKCKVDGYFRPRED